MKAGAQYRHLKRGSTYTVLATGLLQVATRQVAEGDRMVAYRGAEGDVWFRSEAEFLDGRFEHVADGGEAAYRAYRAAQAGSADYQPETLEDTLRSLEMWTPELLPADENGRVEFLRAMLEAAMDAIRAHLARTSQPEAEVAVSS